MGSNGGVIGKTNTPTGSVASGLWDLDDVFQYRGAGTWPKQVASLAWTDSSVIGTDLSVYTFSAQALGTEAPDRHVLVGVSGASTDANKGIPTVTVAGVATPLIGPAAQTTDGSAAARFTQFYIVPLPTGTAEDIVVSFGASQSRCGIAVWAVYGLRSTTPVDSDKFEGTTGTVASMTVDTAEDGLVVAMYSSNGSTAVRSTTWTGGVTERFDHGLEGFQSLSGADAVTPTVGTMTPVATASSALVYSTAVTLSLR